MRHLTPAENQVNLVLYNYHKQEINVCVKDYTWDEQSSTLQHLQTIIKQLLTEVNMVGIPAP